MSHRKLPSLFNNTATRLCSVAVSLGLLMILVSAACADETPSPRPTADLLAKPSATPTAHPTPQSTIEESSIVVQLELGAATATVGQRIYASDVVVRASLLSTSEGSLRFRAVEYLKGSGPSEFTVSVSTANRNTVWDGQEAVLFLSRQPSEGASGSSDSNTSADFQFADTTSWNYYQDPAFTQHYSGELPQGYTVDSRNPVWLPAEQGTGGAGGASDDSSFITASASPTGGSQPVISLADLRSILAWIEGGEGIEGYDYCIRASLDYERYYRDWEAYHKEPWTRYQMSREISSGLGAGAVVHDYDLRRSTEYDVPYLTGPNTNLFRAQNVDDDTVSSNGYHHRLATARPLPTGTYSSVFRLQRPHLIPCAFRPSYGGLEFLVTVTTPAGTLHEAFFDPVTISTTVGADASNGVIDPDEFKIGNDDYEIESIVWDDDDDEVVLTLDDHVSLSGKTLDFIELDGSIDTSLNVSNATVNETAATWTWSLTSAPWENGDTLMLRIRNTSGTPTPTPTPVPPTATPTPVPPTATPTPVPDGVLHITVSAAPSTPPANQPVNLTATVHNGLAGLQPAFYWEIAFSGVWAKQGTGSTLRYLGRAGETLQFRATVTYTNGTSLTSDAVSVTWQ